MVPPAPPTSDDLGRREKKKGLLVRLTVAPAVLAGVLALLHWHDRSGHSLPTDLLMVVMSAGAAYEAAKMLGAGGRPAPSIALCLLFSAALAGLGLVSDHDPAVRGQWRALLLAAAVLVTFLGHFRAAREGDLGRVFATLFPIVYVGFLYGLLREIGDGPQGARLLALSVVAAKGSDIGGWVVGKAVGRHKMIPSVSPGKTWEGTFGGLAFSVGGALVIQQVIDYHAYPASNVLQTSIYALSLGVAATISGLTQSALKRRCGVKDSSTLLPEMGGILDMIDSLLLAAPVAWLWLLLA